MIDEFGDRMKEYEARYTSQLLPLLPTFARIDGKAFHTYTQGMEKPYDPELLDLMCNTTAHLVQETNAKIAYTQSDEITLCFYSPVYKSQIFFNGKTQKMVSVLASMTTAFFNEQRPKRWPGRALFDCRVWQVPTLCEAANVFVWREMDAVRNSISLVAQKHYSHNELLRKCQSELHDMIHAKGDNWNDYPPEFKRGSYFKKERYEVVQGPGVEVWRNQIVRLDLEPILSYDDRVEVLFGIKGECNA